jgi:uncharacterized protein (DUF736 family)
MGAPRNRKKHNQTVATIGTFTSTETGITGSVRTLSFNVKARITRVGNPSDKGRHFHVYASNVELGAAWQKTSGESCYYLSVKLDDPSFSARSTQRLPRSKVLSAYSSSGPARAATNPSRGSAQGLCPQSANITKRRTWSQLVQTSSPETRWA